KIAGSPTGVFVGMCYNDYLDLQISDWEKIDAHVGAGGARSVASGRISFAFDLQGPSVSVDTACSSSLVALHLALQSLERGESEMALAAGANLVLQPEFSIGFSQADMLSADGRCKFCAAGADGFVRSDGVGVVVLKPLSRAQADGDRIYAVIRGSAVTNDGRSSGQLMTPGRGGQEAVLRRAYRDAGLPPAEVDYVEAHGTGTRVGDPVELEALAAVLGEGCSADQKCRVGSVKSNIGHTEGAAGFAGLIKVALALRKGQLPASLHCDTLNPAVPWDEIPLEVQRRTEPWPARPRPHRAGVSAFGLSGTNAHVVVEEAPPPAATRPPAAAGRLRLLPLSARSPEALRALAERYVGFLRGESGAPPIDDLCFAAAVRRTHHDHRLAVWGSHHDELAGQLECFLSGTSRPGLASGRKLPERPGRVVFVFPGQGSQWRGMGRQLMAEEPVFREAIERCEEAMRPFVKWSLTGQLEADEPLDEVDVIQPMIFAMQVALAELWRSWGVEPAAVVGQSLGEVAASHVAGALGLEDAARVICRRSQLVKAVGGRGAMAVVELSLEQTRAELADDAGRLSVAVSSSPRSTVVSGDADAMEELLGRLGARDVFCREIKVDYASHSPHIDPLRDDLLETLEGLAPRSASLPIYSTVTAEPTDGAEFDELYWVRNLREPVLFDPAVQRLVADGHDIFLEVSPHPIVLGAIRQTLRHLGQGGEVLASLMREENERAMLISTLAALYTSGYPVDWEIFPGPGRRSVSLPTYPFERQRFWASWAQVRKPGEARGEAGESSEIRHPLLGRSFLPAAQPGTRYWRLQLSTEWLPYLADHRVQGAVMVPAAAYAEIALEAARAVFGEQDAVDLEGMDFKNALFLDADEPRSVQVAVSPDRPGMASLKIFGKTDPSSEEWTLHASAILRRHQPGEELFADGSGQEPPEDVRQRLTTELPREAFYSRMAERSLEYGPSFQGVETVWCGDGEAIARLALPEHIGANATGYRLHPVLLDACLQVVAEVLPGDRTATPVPVHIERLRLIGDPRDVVWAHVRLGAVNGDRTERLSGDARMLDANGRVLVEVRRFDLQLLSGGARPGLDESQGPASWLYEIAWQPKPLPEEPRQAEQELSRLLLIDGGALGKALAERLRDEGERCITVTPGESFRAVSGDSYEIDPTKPAHYRQLVAEVVRGAAPPCREVLHLWSLSAPPATEATLPTLEAAQELGAISATYLVQALAEEGSEEPPRLWLVTRGAQPAANSDSRGFAQSPIWGLGRVIGYEHPELECRLVDLDPPFDGPSSDNGPQAASSQRLRSTAASEKPHDDGIAALAAELRAADEEDQIALRGPRRYVARFLRHSPTGGAGFTIPAGGERPYRLVTTGVGTLDELRLREIEHVEPGPDEVTIRVAASGLNYRDVMVALGLIPPFQEGSPDLGWECAGTILAVGEGVDGLAVGDPVVGVRPGGCFGPQVLTSAALVAPKPVHLDFEEAATIPIVFTTAYHALCDIARLRSGERVLIHAATGGVGLAAIRIAQWVGAEIFATAGSPAKRELLRSLGVRHVMDSRSLAFAGEVMEVTGGEGIDVVLNSLSGEALEKSFSLLRRFGRFLELGKTDILKDTRLGMRSFEKNVSFHGVDVGQILLSCKELYGELLRRVLERFEQGDFGPLRRRVFPVSQTVAAFRHMARAEHIGKVVISMHDPEVRIEPRAPSAVIERQASYLISGGLGGLGLAVARWMTERGAGHLVLTGRRRPSAETQRMLDELEAGGTQVRIIRTDVADREAMAEALAACRRELPPLRGVVHCAGVLDDGTLTQMDRARFMTVMRPKIDGAWNLHTLTADDPLDFFVLFSSAASLLGSPGQGNYSAANAFLDALAHHRRSQGRPALSVNWGPWSEVGLAARPDRGGRLASRGIDSLTPEEGIAAFARVLELAVAGVAVMPFEAERWARFYPRARKQPCFAGLMDEPAAGEGEEQDLSPAGLLSLDPEERARRLVAYLSQQVSKVVGLTGGELATQESINRFGVDSLMAVELKNRIEADLGLVFPVVDLLKGTTIAQLVARILERLPESAAAEAAEAESSEDLLARLDELSEEQIDELPEEELDALLRDMSRQEVAEA
ncbi:MAG: type I polyketide synthase, partial [bacterium]|nr:type I polyketide synthase [bacterium]